MDLFKRKNKQVLPPLMDDQEIISLTTNYNGVIDFLTGLSDEDYKKTIEVAQIYREAEGNAAKALGIERPVSTYINPPEPQDLEPGSWLDDEPGFLEDEHKAPSLKTDRSRKVKD